MFFIASTIARLGCIAFPPKPEAGSKNSWKSARRSMNDFSVLQSFADGRCDNSLYYACRVIEGARGTEKVEIPKGPGDMPKRSQIGV